MKVEILSRLGIRALVRMKRVCKEWRKLIEEDPCLAKMQLARASSRREEEEALILMSGYDGETNRLKLLLLDDNMKNDYSAKPLEQWFPDNEYWYRVYNSCNGLLCFSIYQARRERVLVCNPLLRSKEKQVILPPTTTVVDSFVHGFSCCGLGFDSSINKYKVLHLYIVSPPKVLTMDMEGPSSSMRWREISDPPPEKLGPRFDARLVYASGALHWWVDVDSNLHKLMSFDLAQEKFRILPRQFDGLVEFVDLRGYLGVAQTPHYPSPSTNVDIWKLKEYEKNVWLRLYTIQFSQLRRDISAFANLTSSNIIIIVIIYRSHRRW